MKNLFIVLLVITFYFGCAPVLAAASEPGSRWVIWKDYSSSDSGERADNDTNLNVGSTECELSGEGAELMITIDKGYPGYRSSVSATLVNTADFSVKIEDLEMSEVPECINIHVTNEGRSLLGQRIERNAGIPIQIMHEIGNDAPEESQYAFTIKLVLVQNYSSIGTINHNQEASSKVIPEENEMTQGLNTVPEQGVHPRTGSVLNPASFIWTGMAFTTDTDLAIVASLDYDSILAIAPSMQLDQLDVLFSPGFYSGSLAKHEKLPIKDLPNEGSEGFRYLLLGIFIAEFGFIVGRRVINRCERLKAVWVAFICRKGVPFC